MYQSVGEMRMEMADMARDSKKEESMCAHGVCTSSHQLKRAPRGYRGQYGGNHLCPKHYERIVDYIRDHGCLPSEDKR